MNSEFFVTISKVYIFEVVMKDGEISPRPQRWDKLSHFYLVLCPIFCETRFIMNVLITANGQIFKTTGRIKVSMEGTTRLH